LLSTLQSLFQFLILSISPILLAISSQEIEVAFELAAPQ
jgi:hypothetical protein